MDELIINDQSMYQYFENLIYGRETAGGLCAEWKKTESRIPYGLNEAQVSALIGSKGLLYGQEDARKQICLLETMQRFLHDYIGIDGLEELLVNNYGTIENSIFFEHDRYGQPANIREHSKHQLKNAYLGSLLLLECGYLQNMAEAILKGRSSVTRYLYYQAKAFLEKEGILEQGEAFQEKLCRKLEEWCYKIYMISALLHDIGYPLEYYLRSSRLLTDYPPYLKLLSPTVKLSFSEVKALLNTSQLFRLVDQEKIREKYDKDNHGVLSAVSLLMHFYYGGRIYSLTQEEQCLVEMSAIAIYRHTDKFQGGSRMVYLQDPVSYMVRLCDDLQEWDRFKLLINEKHNYLKCPKCGKLVQPVGEGKYACGCPTGTRFQKITGIKNKKLNYVCLCDKVILKKETDRVCLVFDFSLIKQVEILLEDYTAVLRRAEDLEKVKELLKNQYLQPQLEIEYFASNNPYYLIREMIRRSGLTEAKIQQKIDKIRYRIKNQNMQEFYGQYLRMKEDRFGREQENNRLQYEEEVQEYVRTYYGEIHTLWKLLGGDEACDCSKGIKQA